MKDETKELFLQSYNVILSRRIKYYHEQYKDCDPQKTIDVKRRIKMEMYSIFYECTNDEHICSISKFLQYFNDQVDQFQSRSYDEHIDNAKKTFEIYYSSRERDFKDGSGKILEWSNKRIACELGKYKAELDFYEMQIEPPSLNYDDKGKVLNDKYTLVPSTTPIVNDTSLFDEMEQEIAKEKSKAKETSKVLEILPAIAKKNFTTDSDYEFLTKLHEQLSGRFKMIREIDIYDFLCLLNDEPTSNKIYWKTNIWELASFVAYLHQNLNLTSEFYGLRNKSINYEKWASLFTFKDKPLKATYLKDVISDIRIKNSIPNNNTTPFRYESRITAMMNIALIKNK